MQFSDLSKDAKANAVQAFSDYFEDVVFGKMLESIDKIEADKFVDFDVYGDGDGKVGIDARKFATPCFGSGDEVPSEPERLVPTDDTLDQLFCEAYNSHVRELKDAYFPILQAMEDNPDAMAVLGSDHRYMLRWEQNMDSWRQALLAYTDDDAEYARLEDAFGELNYAVRKAIDAFADADADATQRALESVATAVNSEREAYSTPAGVSKTSREMGVDFDEDGEPVGLFDDDGRTGMARRAQIATCPSHYHKNTYERGSKMLASNMRRRVGGRHVKTSYYGTVGMSKPTKDAIQRILSDLNCNIEDINEMFIDNDNFSEEIDYSIDANISGMSKEDLRQIYFDYITVFYNEDSLRKEAHRALKMLLLS